MTNPDRSELVKLADCPIGLFLSNHGELCLKTEYGSNEGRIDAYIVSSGEFFWGGVTAGPTAIAEQRNVMVRPVDHESLIRRLASSDGGVKVRELEWRDHRPDSFPEPAWSAQTSFGFYNIEEVSASDSPAYVVRLHAHHFVADKDSLDEAKAAAQTDYEARIKSALVEVPAVKGEPEPVAWRYRYNGKWYLSDTKAFAKAGLDVTPLYTAPPADAGMREALEDQRKLDAVVSVLGIADSTDDPSEVCRQILDERDHLLAAIERVRVSPIIEDAAIANQILNEASQALTAPGATTKSDGGCMADFSPDDPTNLKELMASKPVWSDPSSTRSDPNDQAYADLIASGGIFPEAYQQGEASMTDDQIKHMVDRFLMWKLPEHFNPDCGISFDPTHRSEHGPVGTNLFDAVQATAMVRHMLEGLPSTRREVTVEELARTMVHAVYPNSVGDRWFERDPVNLGSNRSSTVALAGEYACALLDQFEIRRK